MNFLNRLVMVASMTLAGWFETYAYIVDKSGKTIRPTANALQIEVSRVIDWCEANHRPVRLILLKPRQKGCSTVSVGALFRFLKIRTLNACIIGSGFKQSGNLFKIMKTYAKHDNWSVGGACKVLKDIARWANGSTCDRLTANDEEAGRSGTYQVILATEVARWAEVGVSNAKEVLSGLLKTVGNEEGTMVILESTADGAYGDYYERYQKAVTFEQAQEGKPGFIKIFMPWFVFDDSKLDPAKEQIAGVNDLTTEEFEYMEEWELELDQVAWMRWALREECNDDWDKFQQDYPSDEETAFLMSGSSRFSKGGMKFQEQESKKKRVAYGSLEENEGCIGWVPTTESESLWKRWEEPIDGLKYLVSVDQMTGASQTGSADPDSHGVKVWRAGYTDVGGRWHPPAIVASLMLYKQGDRFGNWWDIDVLTEQAWRMSEYYGRCILVIEINMDRGMVELLKTKTANIYTREVFNKRTNEYMDSYGWQTTNSTRRKLIETMAKAVRESPKREIGEGVELNCIDTIREMKTFVRKENGREEAAVGKHDDQVFGAMIGLQTISFATTYHAPELRRRNPRDIRGFEIQHQSKSGFGL